MTAQAGNNNYLHIHFYGWDRK